MTPTDLIFILATALAAYLALALRPGRSRRTDMLTLTRKLGEKIYIGENVCLTVVRIGADRVVIGIDAPRDVRIDREELLPAARAQQEAERLPREGEANG